MSRPSSPARNSASRKSMTAFGSQASCTMISDTSTWSRKPCNPSTTRSARGCHPSLRYVVLPICPGRTRPVWRRGCPTDLRPPASVIVQDRLIYPLFTSLFSVYRTLLLASVRHNPEQMLGHVLGHALEQTRL